MKKIINNIFRILLIILIVAWIGIIVVDYFKVKDGKEPKFCMSESTKTYSDGTVYRCIGLGYKVFRYDRESISAIEFGPIFIQEKNS